MYKEKIDVNEFYKNILYTDRFMWCRYALGVSGVY